VSAFVAASVGAAMAQSCTSAGLEVSCDDGGPGIFSDDAIIWADGSRASLTSPHPSAIIGNKSSVSSGKACSSAKARASCPMENPSDPHRARCPVLDNVPYCY
jgi:hypothetical protein